MFDFTLDLPHCQGLVLSDMVCLENSKNVAYLAGRCDQGKSLLSAQAVVAKVGAVWPGTGLTRGWYDSKCLVNSVIDIFL